MIKNVLFDLDGTIVDTSEGIINSMHYTFDKLNIKRLPDSCVKEAIGPPLEDMLALLLNTKDKETISKGTLYFRERYSIKGVIELKLYNDIISTLSYLSDKNIKLFIVTSKPYKFAEVICKNMGIYKYFVDISGVNLDGISKSKGDRIKDVINKYDLKIKETVMVGDRKEDVLAANQNYIITIGMLYGFGKKEDLESAGCKYFCEKASYFKDILSVIT